jgi:hypothetical protein
MTWATNNGWEDSARSIITSKSSLAHARAVVDNQSGNLVVTHFDVFLEKMSNLFR